MINLKETADRSERHFISRYRLNLVHIPMLASNAPTSGQLQIFFETLLDESKYPIWIHCQGGADRTGIMVALYRLEFQRWPKENVYYEMLSYFHIPAVYPQLSNFLFAYEPQLIRFPTDSFASID